MAVELIAELATNFGSDIELGKQFIRAFASAGVDTIKVQVFDVKHLNAADPQYSWFDACQLRFEDYVELRNECNRLGVRFLATAYHPEDVRTVAALGCDRIKIGSGEAGERKLFNEIRAYGFSKVLVSTGITPPDQSMFFSLGYYGIIVNFLGCVTRYPAPLGIAYPMLQQLNYAGWSDHAIGLDECKAAVVAGARIVEFHVQLPNQARPAKPFEKTADEVHELRAFADFDPAKRYIGRWQYGS